MLTTFILGPRLCKTNISRYIKVEQFHSALCSSFHQKCLFCKTPLVSGTKRSVLCGAFFFFFVGEAEKVAQPLPHGSTFIN